MTKDELIRSILEESHTIAVVGASHDPSRAGYTIPAYLQRQGYRIIPVNPHIDEMLGEKSYASLLDVPEPVDVVEVFRRPEYTPDIVRDAVKIGAKAVWLQQGIVNDEARQIAEAAGIKFVQNECMGPQHRRLLRAS